MSAVPLLELPEVYHLGSLDPAKRGERFTDSLEGPCLSVSLCPHAWQQIAKLGGVPLHRLSRPGGLFLDVLELLRDAKLKGAVLQWAVDEDLVETHTLYRAWSFDDELDGWRYMLFPSESEAFEEFDCGCDSPAELEGPNGGPGIEPVQVPCVTPMLAKRMELRYNPAEDGTDYAVLAWAQDKLPELLGHQLDGVWWSEDYDPLAYSAPRGGIFPERVRAWQKTPAEPVDDEDLLATMPPATWVAVTAATDLDTGPVPA